MKYAIYDMSLHAPSFDFLTFCVVSKSLCTAMGEECRIIFKMGPNKGFKEPNDKPYSVKEKKFRMGHVLYPICTLMGLDYSTDIFFDIEESQILYSKDNSYVLSQLLNQYKEIPLFWPQPSDYAVEMIQNILPNNPIVITLRETYGLHRNSNLEEWLKFGKYIEKKNIVVFVRDTFRWNSGLIYESTRFNTFPIVSIDLDIRLALYQHAKINFSVGGGPTTLLHYSTDIPYRTFKMATKDVPVQKNLFSQVEGFLSKERKPVKDLKTADEIIYLEDESGERCIFLRMSEIQELQRQGVTKFTARDNKGGYQVIYLEDKNTAASPAKLAEIGFPVGSQFPWHSKNQRIVWEDDTFENLKKEYDEIRNL